MDRVIIILEVGFQEYKEPLMKSLREVPGTRLILATGLNSTVNCDWARPYVDDVFFFSYTDPQAVTKLQSYLAEKSLTPSGILTFIEPSVHIANDWQHQLGLPPISNLRDKSIRNKSQMRDRLSSLGRYQPKYTTLRNEEDLKSFLETSVQLPLIMKPSEMMSSLGVKLIETKEQIETHFFQTRDADFDQEDLRTLYGDIGNEVICEQYINGLEYSAEVIVQNGVATILGITKKFTTPPPYFEEVGHQFPADDLSPQQHQALSDLVVATHSKLHYQNTITHTEVRFLGNEPYLMEINSRLGGDLIYELIGRSTGFHLGQLLSDIATGSPVKKEHLKTTKTFSIQFHSTHSRQFRLVGQPESIEANRGLLVCTRLGHTISEGKYQNSAINPYPVQEPISVTSLTTSSDEIWIFNAAKEDLPQMEQIERTAWDSSMEASSDIIAKRFAVNPESSIIAYSKDKKRAEGFATFVPIPKLLHDQFMPWEYYASLAVDPAHLKSSSSYQSLYVISLSVRPDAPRGTGSYLMQAIAQHAQSHNFTTMYYGIRIPNYHKHSNSVSIEDYFDGLNVGKYHEWMHKLARNSNGKAIGIAPNYFEDPDSCNYGIIIEHECGK